MGLITIACPSCKALTEWFTGNPDQRCHRCKYEAQQSPKRMSFGEWANDIRTVKLMEMNERRSERFATLQGYFNAQYDKIADQKNEIAELERRLKMYEPVSQYNGLSIEEWRTAALKAESELSQEQGLRHTYMRAALRRLKVIGELRGQANELRAQLERVRQALGVGQNLQNLAP